MVDRDPYKFWSYDDLVERGLVTSRTDLFRKQRDHGFPRPIKLTNRTARWRVIDVMDWVDGRPVGTANDADDES